MSGYHRLKALCRNVVHWFTRDDVSRYSRKFVRRTRLFLRIGLRDAFSSLDGQAVATVSIAVVLSTLAYLVVPFDNAALMERFLPEHVTLYSITDSGPQRIAFLIFCLAILLGSIVLPLLVARSGDTKTVRHSFLLEGNWTKPHLVMGYVLLAAVAIELAQGSHVLNGATIVLLAIVLRRYSHSVWINWAIVSALVVFLIVPGWIGTPIPVSQYLTWHDIHYAAVLSQGERLAAGDLLYENNTPPYGVLIPIAIGILTRLDHIFSFAGLMRLTQAGQTLCLLFILAAAWLRTRACPAPGRVLALLIVVFASAPFVNALSPAIWAPNQSGLRFMMVPVAVIVASTLESMQPGKRSAIVGLTVGVAFLSNFETGVAIAAGLGLAWLISVRQRRFMAVVGYAVIGMTVMVCVIGVVAMVYHLTFGGWPFPVNSDALRSYGLVASGYIGRSFDPNVPALLILVHSSYLVSRGLRHLVSPNKETPSIPDTAISGMILAWFPYWINRPMDWNLWTYIVMYSLLLAPSIAARGRRLVPLAVAALLVLPSSFKFVKPDLLTPLTREQWMPGWHSGCGDGLVLPANLCAQLEARATVLKEWAARGEVIWLTGFPMLTMRMTGERAKFRTIDMFALAPNAILFGQLLDNMKEMEPVAILYDNPTDTVLWVPEQKYAFNDRLLAAMSSKACPSRLSGGWRIVELTDACTESGQHQ